MSEGDQAVWRRSDRIPTVTTNDVLGKGPVLAHRAFSLSGRLALPRLPVIGLPLTLVRIAIAFPTR